MGMQLGFSLEAFARSVHLPGSRIAILVRTRTEPVALRPEDERARSGSLLAGSIVF
jgi:hypothetical protein